MAAALLGCGGDNPVGGEVAVQPIVIESVEVLVLESAPPQVSVHVKGVIGDGCSELHSETQQRTGNTVRLTILRARREEAICIQIARLYDQVVRLTGTYPAGRYTVHVNDVERTFVTQ